VVLKDYLARQSRDHCHVTNENVSNFCNFWAWFDSFDVSGSCHVIVEHHLARRSRDNCQNNYHNSQKHVLYQILQENVFKPWFLQL